MDSSAISRRDKYCHNGGMAFAPGSASACLGVHDGDHGPFRRSPENSPFAGEKPQGLGSVPFGGSDGLVCLRRVPSACLAKYCHNGAWVTSARSPSGPKQSTQGARVGQRLARHSMRRFTSGTEFLHPKRACPAHRVRPLSWRRAARSPRAPRARPGSRTRSRAGSRHARGPLSLLYR
jgi:hypothetical protein